MEYLENYLEKRPFVAKNGQTYGPDPREYFAGSPYDTESMGCYAPVIEKTLNKVLEAEVKWQAKDLTGVPMEELLSKYIDNDMPVIFWACIDLKEAIIGPEWIVEETGEVFTWKSNEHCMLLVGYDENYYYFNDPWHNHGMIGYEKALVEKRHEEQYEMAVAVTCKDKMCVKSSIL